jgi:hypothetical protein
VLRGGYGIYYATIPMNFTRGEHSNPPWGTPTLNFVTQIPVQPTSPFLPDITFQNPFPSSAGSPNGAAANPAITFDQHELNNPRVEQWSLTLEHQFAESWMTRATYMGSKTDHITWQNSDINVPATQNLDLSIQAQRPLQPWSSIYSYRSGGEQNLEQLQLELIKRYSSGFTAQVEYQWTRSLDDVPFQYDLQNWHYPMADYGNSDWIRRHFLVSNFIYELPFGKGRHWLPAMSRIAEGVVGGWQVSGITTYGTGTPFSVDFYVPTSYPGWWGGRADAVSGVSPYAKQSGHDVISGVQWFNPAAFTAPTPGTWGNSARNSLFGPGVANWDLSLAKSFAFEKSRLEFRVDFLDAFNHFNLGNPANTIAATQYGGSPISSAGVIYGGQNITGESVYGNRAIQVGLRYRF